MGVIAMIGFGKAPAAGGSLLLDESGIPAAVFAVSGTRKLRAAWAGAAGNVRENGGDTDAPVGFSGEGVDQSDITTHCGANSGFWNNLQDQTGNANHAAQATDANQPRICNAGTVEKVGTIPATRFIRATPTYFDLPAGMLTSGAYTLHLVIKGLDATNPQDMIVYVDTSDGKTIVCSFNTDEAGEIQHYTRTSINEAQDTTAHLVTDVHSLVFSAAHPGNLEIYVDGSVITPSNSMNDPLEFLAGQTENVRIGIDNAGGDALDAYFFEAQGWNSQLTGANVTTLWGNVQNFYGGIL